jgi:hypothetical protein
MYQKAKNIFQEQGYNYNNKILGQPTFPEESKIGGGSPAPSADPRQGGRLGLKAMRSVLGGTSPEHTLCLLCCEYDQLPTALEHTSMGFPGPHMLPVGVAEQRSAVYSSNVSTSRLDTAQIAMIR